MKLAGFLAVAAAGSALAVAITGPVIARFRAVVEKRDPIVTPFQRIYQRALKMSREEP